MFGTTLLKPCRGMMAPEERDDGFISQVCGCGFTWVSYDEDAWFAMPDREAQLAVMHRAEELTRGVNRATVWEYASR